MEPFPPLDQIIPYEPQADAARLTMCGAAALTMVYRSYRLPASQHDVWERIGGPTAREARTLRLARDARANGLHAVIVQARDPLQLLRRAAKLDVRLILNVRARPEAARGHFVVFVGLIDWTVIVHDPANVPFRRLTWAELCALWRPHQLGRATVPGYILVAIDRVGSSAASSCPGCGANFPSSMTCSHCGSCWDLQPAEILGCPRPECVRRTWERLFCSLCDGSVEQCLPGHK